MSPSPPRTSLRRSASSRAAFRATIAALTALSLLACQTRRDRPPSSAPGSPRPVPAAATFHGVVDPRPDSLALGLSPSPITPGSAPGTPSATVSVLPEGPSGVTLSSSNVTADGDGCGGQTFEGDVTVTNHGGATLRNVYAEILTISSSGREACNSSAVPRPGSDAVSARDGLWAYGDIPAGGSKTVRWRFGIPNLEPYTFTGRVITAGELSSTGAGGGMGATIDELLVDSDGTNLYVTVAFSSAPTGHRLFLLVDDVTRDRALGMTDLSVDPTGSGSALSDPGGATLANGVGADLDYYEVGTFAADGTLTRTSQRTITGPTTSVPASGTAATQDPGAGRYHFAIPYAAFGAAPADRIKVYALFGEPNAGGQGGIHSAAPAPPADQRARMDSASGSGLAALSTAPASHTLHESVTGTCPPTLHFAVIGDYGYAGATGGREEAAVAALVKSWNPDLIITLGDNDYDHDLDLDGRPDFTIDENIGQFYAPWIGNYRGGFGPGAAQNAFFPSLGNHDMLGRGRTDGGAYLDYFTLPGNERYYEFTRGDVHFFVLDSNEEEPDGRTPDSIQAAWLQGALALASEPWKIVYFHHPAHTSGNSADTEDMIWPFALWGASAVLSGHEHNYERLSADGIPYFVNGMGGDVISAFGTRRDSHSLFVYDAKHGAQRVVSNGASLRFDFVNVDGATIDSLVLARTPCVP